ncbi:MAG: RsmB/NOP family class I SAM-dependent RNA methyltransferase, partial [Nitriliruptoraceae bacterium]
VRRSVGARATGFVNGVLRGLARRRDDLPWPTADEDPVEHLALTTGHPGWVVADLLPRYGLERTRSILAADDLAPGLTLRATGDRDALLAELVAAGIEAEPGAAPEAIRAPGTDPRELAAVAEGRAVPQDEASMQVVHATGAAPTARALDLCAGPGGKATHLAQLGAEVTAIELHAHRARLVAEAAQVQGVAVDVRVGDARDAPLEPDARFDVVLLDAPCTGLGTGRRRPEVRWRQRQEDAQELAALQGELLTAAARWVAAGGRLTYAVCTWTAAETDGVVEAAIEPLAAAGLHLEGRRQLLPDVDDTDGMFIAIWTREGPDER